MVNVKPYLSVSNTVEALKSYAEVFDATIGERMPVGEEQAKSFGLPEGADLENMTMHASFKIFNSEIFIADNFSGKKTNHPNVTIMIEPDTLDQMKSIYEQAKNHSWDIGMELEQQFWGDYYCDFTDPFGISWSMNFSPKASD